MTPAQSSGFCRKGEDELDMGDASVRAQSDPSHDVRPSYMTPLCTSHFRPDSLLASNSLVHHLLILFIAVLVCLPCLLTGIPPGYDSPTHVSYQHHFNQQFWKGEFYPRWLVDANKGYGSPTFFIQYPLPYFITALLHGTAVFPSSAYREARELGIFCFLVILAAGFAARFWFRKRFNSAASTLGAIVYMALPYVLACLYTRAAIGELAAFVWMPLIFAMCDSLEPRLIGVLGLLVALLIVSNLLIACLFVPVMILYSLGAGALTPRSLTCRVAVVFGGLVLGVGVSAIYLLPLLVYRHLFDVSQMQANLPGFELGRYFVFLTSSSFAGPKALEGVLIGSLGFAFLVAGYIWHATGSMKLRAGMAIILGLGTLAAIPDLGPRVIRASGLQVSGFDTPQGFSRGLVITVLFTIGLGFLSYCRTSRVGADWRNTVLLAIASGALFFMLPWSAPVWKAIPALATIQFPFRNGAVLSVAVAGLVAAAIDDTLRKPDDANRQPPRFIVAIAIMVTLCAGVIAWRIDSNFRHPRTVPLDEEAYVDINYRMYVAPSHITAFSEMLGTDPGSFQINPTQVHDAVQAKFVKGQGTVNVRRVGFRDFIVSVDSSGDGLLELNQVYFPLWKLVAAPHRNTVTVESSAEGLIEIPVTAGKQDLNLVLERGWPERYGFVVTATSLLAVGALCWFFRVRRHANENGVV